MKRIVVWLLILVVGGGVVASLYAGSFITKAIERAGSDALGTPVQVTAVTISPLSGTASVFGLRVKNPKGFSDHDVLNLSGFNIQLELKSLLTDTVHIRNILINEPKLRYEMNGPVHNIGAMRKNIAGHSGTTKKADAANTSGTAKKLKIDHVEIRAATLTAAIAGVTKNDASITLPDITIKEPGGKDQAITVERASEIIIGTLLDAAMKADLGKLLQGQLKEELKGRLDELKKDPLKAIGGEGTPDVKGATDSLKKLF
jgi:hypothetical protein